MRKLFLALPLALGLAACAGQQQAPVVNPAPKPVADVTPTPAPVPVDAGPLAKLKDFTIADLTAASTDAHAHNDQTAYQCYDYLIQVIPTLPSFQPGSTVGAVLAFQKLRDLNNDLGGVQGALKSLNLACAPLVIDTQTTINKLLLIGAGSAATAGTVTPFIAPLVGGAP